MAWPVNSLHYLWTVILHYLWTVILHYLWTVILTIKGIHVDQAVFDRLTKGQLTIITHRNSYAVISVPLADKIRARDELHFIVIADQTNGQLDEDDPYAAYQIPDDLMR
ncbi:MAG: hypothetical protein CSH37_15340 [Thalassolituus sp.]|nr:MAG: hypothetical protein CSH37_15340 [Thalassolituus sp.]